MHILARTWWEMRVPVCVCVWVREREMVRGVEVKQREAKEDKVGMSLYYGLYDIPTSWKRMTGEFYVLRMRDLYPIIHHLFKLRIDWVARSRTWPFLHSSATNDPSNLITSQRWLVDPVSQHSNTSTLEHFKPVACISPVRVHTVHSVLSTYRKSRLILVSRHQDWYGRKYASHLVTKTISPKTAPYIPYSIFQVSCIIYPKS